MIFRANGKLLLTAEYLVLDGATCLALPTKMGQIMEVEHSSDDYLHWECLDEKNSPWFAASFNWSTGFIENTSDQETAQELKQILEIAHQLNPSFSPAGKKVTCKLEFPIKWGLGSSSTLRVNVANWAKIPAIELHNKTSNGSGYDIAAGSCNSPILYSNKDSNRWEEIEYSPPYSNELFFVYLNKKQKSEKEVNSYIDLKKDLDLNYAVQAANKLTHRIVNANDLTEFESAIKEHELFLSTILQRPCVQESIFPDYELGTLKSLGAWGGDFILATGTSRAKVTEYFNEKGFSTVLPYANLIL